MRFRLLGRFASPAICFVFLSMTHPPPHCEMPVKPQVCCTSRPGVSASGIDLFV